MQPNKYFKRDEEICEGRTLAMAFYTFFFFADSISMCVSNGYFLGTVDNVREVSQNIRHAWDFGKLTGNFEDSKMRKVIPARGKSKEI